MTSVKTISEDGSEQWLDEYGELHREGDLPAFIKGGNMIWYIHGVIHRENNQTAAIYQTGGKYWAVNGKVHRTDGPAFTSTKKKEWFLSNKRIKSAEEFQRLTGNSDEQMAEILLKYGSIA